MNKYFGQIFTPKHGAYTMFLIPVLIIEFLLRSWSWSSVLAGLFTVSGFVTTGYFLVMR